MLKNAGFSLVEVLVAVGWSEPPYYGASGGPSIVGGARTDCCDPKYAFDGDVNTFWAGANEQNVNGGEWRLPTPLPSCYIPSNLSQVMPGKERPTPIIPGVQFERYFQIQPSSNCSSVDLSGSKRLVTVYVTWKDALGNHQSSLSSCLSDWR